MGYTFDIETAGDMLKKADRELRRLDDPFADRTDRIDHAINFATTAWHIVDWLSKSSDPDIFKALQRLNLETLGKLHAHVRKECAGLQVCHQIATGAKHLEVHRLPQGRRVADTTLSAVDASPMAERPVYYVLKVLVDGNSLRVADLFQDVMRFWTSLFSRHGLR